MELSYLSHFFAKFLGLFFVVVSLAILKNQRLYTAIIKKILEYPVLLFIVALFDLSLGMFIVFTHNIWVMGWPVIITVFGWLLLIRGVLRIVFPQTVINIYKKLQPYFSWILRISTVTLFVLGVYLFLMGFYG